MRSILYPLFLSEHMRYECAVRGNHEMNSVKTSLFLEKMEYVSSSLRTIGNAI